MSSNNYYIALAIWILASGSIFAESFEYRPTTSELNEIVISGSQVTKGLNERCWATQYSTNPAQYRVAPFTNNSRWYLDQSLMGTMATKTKELVSYYADPDSVYEGTTNISMYTVPGLFTELDIGNHTDKFTKVFASGTNAAIYGDSPWWICQSNLDERNNVLEALEITEIAGSLVWTNMQAKSGMEHSTYDAEKDAFVASSWFYDSSLSWYEGAGAHLDNSVGLWNMFHIRVKYETIINAPATNVSLYWLRTFSKMENSDAWDQAGVNFAVYWTNNAPAVLGTYVLLIGENNPALGTSRISNPNYFGNDATIVPNLYPTNTYDLGWRYGPPKTYGFWNFQYCTDE